ncbi:MAG: FkbM family methyltransferase [Oscillospiraceae bacterium]|jgi:FkbM family methyltransferase|nr:FkbM family methyltransferase [Oscillospiraceae bacterium]
MKPQEIITKLAVHFNERGDQISLDCLRFQLSRGITMVEEINKFKPRSFERSPLRIIDKNGCEKEVPNKVILYGAGVYGFLIKQLIETVYKSEVVAFIDSNKTGNYYNKPIITIHEYKRKEDYADVPLVVSVANPQKIEYSLREAGVDDYFHSELTTAFWTYVKFTEAKRLLDVSGKPQYFSLKELNHSDEEVFVDCGTYDGQNIKDFILWAGEKGYKKIFAFEPDPICFDASKQNLCDVKKLYIKKAAITDKIGKGMLMIQNLSKDNPGASSVLNEIHGTHETELTTLDSEFADETVSFIKMDIEGAELSALKGGEEIIRRCKPKLAICVYHELEDLWQIPNYIWSINPNYKFYLRHYSDSWCETVLYAVNI